MSYLVALFLGLMKGSVAVDGCWRAPKRIESSSSISSLRRRLLRQAYHPPTTRARAAMLLTDAMAATTPVLSPSGLSSSTVVMSVVTAPGTSNVVERPCSSVVVSSVGGAVDTLVVVLTCLSGSSLWPGLGSVEDGELLEASEDWESDVVAEGVVERLEDAEEGVLVEDGVPELGVLKIGSGHTSANAAQRWLHPTSPSVCE